MLRAYVYAYAYALVKTNLTRQHVQLLMQKHYGACS